MMHKLQLFVCLIFLFVNSIVIAQYKQFSLNQNGDTINAINNDGKKVGKWVIEVGELRGEPGYVEEGVYKKGEKHGYWRKYTTLGDLLAVENYIYGGKAGLQQYFTFLGELEHEENWKGYNPDAPYDTIPVYGTGSGEIVDYKIVKAEPYSVKDGEWRYYEAGRLLRTEQWSNNNIVNPAAPKVVTSKQPYVKPEKVEKTPSMLDWEKKHRGKKYVEGATHL
jgi:antitoxin component YwqK of YwqJK toxin-antitoxin module